MATTEYRREFRLVHGSALYGLEINAWSRDSQFLSSDLWFRIWDLGLRILFQRRIMGVWRFREGIGFDKWGRLCFKSGTHRIVAVQIDFRKRFEIWGQHIRRKLTWEILQSWLRKLFLIFLNILKYLYSVYSSGASIFPSTTYWNLSILER